jgi:hypothetical protein
MEEQRKKLRKAVLFLINFRPTDYPKPPTLFPNQMLDYSNIHRNLELSIEHFDAFREAFLTVLTRLSRAIDDCDVDAWRAILDAGIAYMNEPRRQTM